MSGRARVVGIGAEDAAARVFRLAA